MPKNLGQLSIGELARATGIKVETIRYYERVGMLSAPERTAGNYRAYRAVHRDRLAFIGRARELGFSLAEIRSLLHLSDRPDASCEEVDRIAQAHLATVKSKIAALTMLEDELRRQIEQCRHETVAQCRVIEAIASPSGRARRSRG